MLVLSRQRDQSIMIGDDVEITIVDVRGDKVRIGINAPREISVHRKEVYEAIRREAQATAKPATRETAADKPRTTEAPPAKPATPPRKSDSPAPPDKA